MAQAQTPSGPGRTTFALNGAAFENQAGVGLSIVHRLSMTSIPVYLSFGYGNGGGKENVFRGGVGFEW
jgi:hypothetical protein